jgi:F-type H+-transporting ATPase subunit epsilon
MSDATMHVEVVSAESHVISADVTGLFARGVEGEIGILPGHQSAVVALDVGAVKLTFPDGHAERVAVHRGVLFVDRGVKVIVLADIAELDAEIDVARAEERKRELEAQLAREEDAVVRASLRKQQLRLDVAHDR